MPSLLHFGVRTVKNTVRTTNLADGRFLYRNSSPRDAGKYIPIYYGEMSNSQKRFSMFCLKRLHFLEIEKDYATVRFGPLKPRAGQGAEVGAVLRFCSFCKFPGKRATLEKLDWHILR